MKRSPNEITQMLLEWSNGHREAHNELMPLVYDELRRLAAHYLRQERPDHTLQPTALVHEALTGLAVFDPQQSRIVELRFFGGLTIEEAAEVLRI